MTDAPKRLVGEELANGLARARRTRRDFHVNLWTWAVPHDDPRRAVDDARPTIAAYSCMPEARSHFEALGFLEEVPRIRELIQRGDLAGAAKRVPDEIVREFVVCGSDEEIRDAIERRAAIVGTSGSGRLSDEAYDRIKEAIVCCELAPGCEVSEAQLVARFGFGKASIRSALARLTHERWVRALPRRGHVIGDLTLRGIQEVFELRLLLRRRRRGPGSR